MLLKFDQFAMHCCRNPAKDEERRGEERRGEERRGEERRGEERLFLAANGLGAEAVEPGFELGGGDRGLGGGGIGVWGWRPCSCALTCVAFAVFKYYIYIDTHLNYKANFGHLKKLQYMYYIYLTFWR